MSKIYASFSNPAGDLKQVTTEFSGLFNFFNSKEIKQKADFGFVLNASVDTLTSDIVAGQKDIRVFLFSGHSGGSGLDFGEADFSSEHLARFFNTINSDDSKIDCVILNGCRNAEIVRRLSHVPVVIGTKTEINDDVAQKFTNDFFRALIESGSSYKQAFVDAVAAQDNISSSIHTRTEGGGEVPPEERLNDYFIYIDGGYENRSFPFKKKGPNYTRYLLIFFLAVAGLLTYLYRHPIEKMLRGYSCALIKNRLDNNKCNFVIADFTTDQTIDFPTWLEENLITSQGISNYLNCINIGSFGSIIKENAVDRNNLPQLCSYDFHLTGSFTAEGERYRAEFNIYPFDPDQLSSSTFVYHVESLGDLDTLVTFLNPAVANQFVLFELCASCAVQKGIRGVIPSMVTILDGYTFDTATVVSYQRMQLRLSEVALQTGDTSLALAALDKLAGVRQNDFALMALERRTKIVAIQNDIPNLYLAQTKYLDAMEKRVKVDTGVVIEKSNIKYKDASRKIRLERAELVTKHNEVLIDKRPEAIKDYEDLDRTKYQDRIKVLRGKDNSTPGGGVASGVVESSPAPFTRPAIESGSSGMVAESRTPSAVMYRPVGLHQDAIMEPGSGMVLERGVEQPLRVAVLTHAKEEKAFQEITDGLTKSAYKVDQKLSRMDLDENSRMLKVPTVIFYNPDMKVNAYQLARTLSKAYNKEFQVLPAAELPRHNLLSRNPEALDLVVYWE